ncbi:hypothetical protein AMATHDRAFT_9250 [Amanita thiersii Skay4041]|uniref:Uncharacterized protein n=1 Tax=Amanita thiersii Skay4041 TaxID=703135 RepID=A0A2A9N8M0_9AGAR|nr:hypothetical protein AMATHDRAFT_9250 [Amanita thiersii Skay4041]
MSGIFWRYDDTSDLEEFEASLEHPSLSLSPSPPPPPSRTPRSLWVELAAATMLDETPAPADQQQARAPAAPLPPPTDTISLLRQLEEEAAATDRDGNDGARDFRLFSKNIHLHMENSLSIKDVWPLWSWPPTAEATQQAALIWGITNAVQGAVRGGGGRGRAWGGCGRRGHGGQAGGSQTTCARCARVGHTVDNCFATTTTAGIQL